MGKQIKKDNDLEAILKKSDDLEAMLKRCDDLEAALEDDDIFKAVLEEQFIKEAEAMEKAIFADEDFEDYDASDEEVHASYEKLVARLKADGIYREEVASEKIIPMPTKRETREKPLPPSAKKLLRNAGFTVQEEADGEFVSIEKDRQEETASAPKEKAAGEYQPHAPQQEVQKNIVADQQRKEPQKKRKTVFWRSFGKVAGMVVLCTVCVFAASMTSEANRKYFVNNFHYLTGNNAWIVNDNDEENDKANTDEYEAIADIEKELEVEVPGFLYRPSILKYHNYKVNKIAETAWIEYQYGNNMLVLFIDKQKDLTASKIDSLHGDDLEVVTIIRENIDAKIERAKDKEDDIPSYSAEWERSDVIYHISGKIELGELKKIIENMAY